MAYTVLVVEDIADERELLTEYLGFRGFVVLEARTGAEAIVQARRRRPDMVLMDLGLPVMDGWQATRELRQDPKTRDLIIVAVTAHAMPKETGAAIEAGCDAVITKPYDIDALAGVIGAGCEHGVGAVRLAIDRLRPAS